MMRMNIKNKDLTTMTLFYDINSIQSNEIKT